ncbi:hypothetical protein ACKAV7_012890 [Fusarium commune]
MVLLATPCPNTYRIGFIPGWRVEWLPKLQKLSQIFILKVFVTENLPRAISSFASVTLIILMIKAPRYIVGNLNFTSAEDLILDDICLIDFDQAFLTSAPPRKTLGTPPGLLAPEVAVGKSASPASDVWALGCSILQTRSGSSPFSIPNVDSLANLLGCVSEYIGRMPTSWGEPLFDDDGLPTTDTTNGESLGEIIENTGSLKQWISDIWDQPDNLEELQSTSTAPDRVKGENKPYLECYSNKFWKPASIRIDDIYLGAYSDKVDKIIESLQKISTHEADLLYDLTSKIFVYEPAQRVSARDILAHPWFHLDDRI